MADPTYKVTIEIEPDPSAPGTVVEITPGTPQPWVARQVIYMQVIQGINVQDVVAFINNKPRIVIDTRRSS